MDMKLEVVMIGVTDIDRAKAFYESLGWRLDGDFTVGDGFRVLQLTPHNSEASIIFGKGIRSAGPGLADGLVLAVDDVEAARADLAARGVGVSEVFHYAAGPFNNTGENSRVGGRDPEGRSYYSFASFEDPDGNGWLLQEIKQRLPGRETSKSLDGDAVTPEPPPTAVLLDALKRAAAAHGVHEKELGGPDPDWPQWYAEHMSRTLREARASNV